MELRNLKAEELLKFQEPDMTKKTARVTGSRKD